MLDLARLHADAFVAATRPRAILVTGSVAEGEADRYSDLDVIAYYGDLPSEEAVRATRERLNADRFAIRWSGEFGIAESSEAAGVICDIGHLLVSEWERRMARVLEAHEPSAPIQKALLGLLAAIPLHGEDLVREWKARAAVYPEPLARAMVELHLAHLYPAWHWREYLQRRDGAVWVRQVLVEGAQDLLGILAGLNRVYYSPFQLKRLHAFAAGLRVAPADLAARLERAVRDEENAAISELESITAETLLPVQAQMPEADMSRLAKQPGERYVPWQP